MKFLNQLKCFRYDKCGNNALSIVNNFWVCGDCLIKLQAKIMKLKEQIMLEEDFDDSS